MRLFTHRRWIYSVVLCVLGVLAAVATISFGYNTARASQETRVELVSTGSARVGEPFTVKLVVENSHNLAGFQSSVNYDAAVVKVGDVTFADGLKSNGRDMLPLGPTGREGLLILGAATCPGDCTSAEPWNNAKATVGVDGRVELADLSFYSDVPGSYELKLDNVKLVDPQGNLLTTVTANTVIQVR